MLLPSRTGCCRILRRRALRGSRLQALALEVGREMEYPGRPIDHLFFIEEGIGAMTTTFLDGSQVEVGMFGFESVIGISALTGTKHSLNRIYMQMAGSGFSILRLRRRGRNSSCTPSSITWRCAMRRRN